MKASVNYKKPRQRLSYSSKGKKWRKDNVDFGDTMSLYNSESVRQTLKNKIINLNLYNGIVDVRDMVRIVNPHQIEADFIPDNIPHTSIISPKINLLVGEEMKRRFDYKIITTNQDAISKKEEDLKGMLTQKITEFLQENYTDDILKTKLEELNEYTSSSWSDAREKMASSIIRHYWDEEGFQEKFSDGFRNALIFGEEIYMVEILHKEPKLSLLNPLKVRNIQSGNSDRIEDSQLIIIEDYWSPGRVIDVFHDELKASDVEEIASGEDGSRKSGSYTDDHNNHVHIGDALGDPINDWLDYAQLNGHTFGKSLTDEDGNIRVLRVYWKSVKKLLKVKKYDDYGDVQYELHSEEYIINKELGEESTTLWVNEWWEGTKIGNDIYLKMKPKEVQYNSLENPSLCHPGIIGQIYNTNQGKAVSLVDRVKNLQYMYDAINDRTNKAIAANHGKILELDLAKIPNNWDVDKWLHFAFVNKIAVVDSFKAGTEGAATGKLAGGMATGMGGRVIDMEMGNYIQQHINLLEYIKGEIGDITGVSRQREGQIENRETKGGIERSVTQSSHITEYWFNKHENLKLRVIKAFLETAKIALKGDSKKVQYILDDESIQTLNINGDEFAEHDYGIVIANTNKLIELDQSLKRYAEMFLQKGGGFKTVMDIYLSPSLSDMRRKLEAAENKQAKSEQEQNKANMKLQEEAMIRATNESEADRDLKRYEIDKEAEVKLAIAEMKQESDNEKLDADREKDESNVEQSQKDLELKIKTLDQDMKKHKETLAVQKSKNNVSN